jgi:predicted signal transduction protein with EAL and GGDEF domain
VAGKLAKLTPEGAQVARLGGDEFAVLINVSHACKDATNMAAAIHCLFKEPFNIDGRIIVVGASIGIALADDPAIDAVELIRQADLAMYRAKDLGRGRTVLYETTFDEDHAEQHLLESDLREAIAANDLAVAFQPLVDAKTSHWLGVEALARWVNKRTGESVSPMFSYPLPSGQA